MPLPILEGISRLDVFLMCESKLANAYANKKKIHLKYITLMLFNFRKSNS
jgi:hypothetical protein